MPTVDELLEQIEGGETYSENVLYCIIDEETREISIPPEYQIFGVESDEKAERVWFQCPKVVGDNIDLTELQLRVNFQNANEEKDQYIVEDVTESGDNIEFSWLLSRKVTRYMGTVSFIVCAVKVTDSTVTNEWNTTLAQSQVLEGLEVEAPEPSEEQMDVITQLLNIVESTSNQAVQDIAEEKETALSEIGTASTQAQSAIETKKQEVIQAGEDALSSIEIAGSSAVESVEEAEQSALDNLSGVTLEKVVENYYALRRTGKVYQTKLWKFASNPSSTGEKLLDNAGLVFEPSTDTEEGQDDYLNGKNPLFEWVNVNYTRDADGTPRPIAIEGTSDYKTEGAVDVGVMQMSFWWSWDTSNAEYDLITISDLPHPELGLVPWPECVKADGTMVPWCIGSKYISGIASDGKLRSQPGLKPERNQSHNNMITNYQAKGDGYWGAGACRNVFQFIFNAIKGGTKNSQTLFAGCTSYNYQYEAAVRSAEAHTYFPVTNAQAGNLVVGSSVSVGYAGNNNGAENRDRGQVTVHSYADNVKILSIDTLDENNKAVYLDLPEEDAFDTQPHAYAEEFSAPIILSTMHWFSGATDGVKGRHDGSPVSNTNGKYPYRVQGREYAVGGYIVASDTVMDLQSDFTKYVLVAPKGVAHSSSDATIRSTYIHIGTIPAATAGNNADWWIGDFGLSTDVGGWWPTAEGSGSSQGTGDRCYAGGVGATSGMREYLQGGHLGVGSYAGSAFLDCWGWLDGGSWHYLACD